jgi:iron complex transport system substrate-binding protein
MLSVPEPVRRVVTLAPSVTELAFAAGAGERVVGVTDADDYPSRVADLPRFQALPLDFEAVVSLAPELAIASDEVNDPRDAERLESLGIPTYTVHVGSLSDVSRVVRDLGRLMATSSAAERAADSLDARLARLGADSSSGRPAVLVLVGDETLFAFGRGSYVHEMVALAGGRSITSDFEMRAPVLSEEYVIDAAPDLIIGAWGTDYDTSRLMELHPGWTEVPALRNGRVHSMDPDIILRPGPRLVEGTEALSRILAQAR